MLRLILLFIFILSVFGEVEKFKTVMLDEGGVAGAKYWKGDFYEFYGIPYASVPKGRDRFQGPLPPKPWKSVIEVRSRNKLCPQTHYTGSDEDLIMSGDEECLFINLFVPIVASEENLVPVLVYIHSGAYAAGNGNMANYHYLAQHDVLVVSFNYRLGAIGFACLGTKDIPGNAGLKDQVYALKWIKKYIKRFGGDPKRVTVAGFSTGASLAELLLLSKTTKGLINKIILESGSALTPFAINVDPINTAKNIAISIGYNDTGKLEDLNEFYLNAPIYDLCKKSLNFFLTNSTFGYAPCIEKVEGNVKPFLTESPLEIMIRGDYETVPVLTGFANMEGISRLFQFESWSKMMNENFEDFLPADLNFNDNDEKEKVLKQIKEYYFNGEDVTHDNIQAYVDYFSDSMFKYGIMKSAKFHAKRQPVYFYEFSYVGELNMKHNYMDKIKGASHRDQSAYILDFFSWTNNSSDMNMRDKMTAMWTDFVKYEDPTAYETELIDIKWPKYTNEDPTYLSIGDTLEVMKDPFKASYAFWDEIYNKYYRHPKPPQIKKQETRSTEKSEL